MGFLIRCIFWLSLVLLIVPIGRGGGDQETQVSPVQAFFAAREAVSDVAGICERKPDVCATGKAALQTISARARESARIAYEMIEDDKSASQEAPIVTGSIPLPAENPKLRSDQ